MSAIASTASKDLSARGWLGLVPPLPDNGDQAYAQWNDDWDHCQPLAYDVSWQRFHYAVKHYQRDAYKLSLADPSRGTPGATVRYVGGRKADGHDVARSTHGTGAENSATDDSEFCSRRPVSGYNTHVMALFNRRTPADATAREEEFAFTNNEVLPLVPNDSDANRVKNRRVEQKSRVNDRPGGNRSGALARRPLMP